MTKAFLLDMTLCMGCEACVIACKTGNQLPEGAQYISLVEHSSGSFPNVKAGFDNHRCFHCSDAVCVSVCPTGALYKDDGLTRLDRDACSGCEYCVQSCPYEVPQMVDGRSSKCDGCASNVGSGGSPWCVETCPAHALSFGDRDVLLEEAKTRVAMMKSRWPGVQVYGETQAGGLGLIMVLPDGPETIGLPIEPAATPAVTNVWKNVIQPVSMVSTGAAAVGAAVLGVIARRNHLREVAEVEEERELEGANDE